MTGIQFIERDGKREFAVIPIELYERLSAALEDADDVALFEAARATDDGFRIPAAVANAIAGRRTAGQGLARTARADAGCAGREGRDQQALPEPDRDPQACRRAEDTEGDR